MFSFAACFVLSTLTSRSGSVGICFRAQCSASAPAVTGQQTARVDLTVRTDCTRLALAEQVSQTPAQSCSVQTLGSPSEQRNNTLPVLTKELNSFGQDVHISSCPHPPSPSPLGPSLPSQSSLAPSGPSLSWNCSSPPSGPSFRTAVPILQGPALELQFPSFRAQLQNCSPLLQTQDLEPCPLTYSPPLLLQCGFRTLGSWLLLGLV